MVFVLLAFLGEANMSPCPGTTQSARSNTLCLLSICLKKDYRWKHTINSLYFCSSSEPADFHRSGSCRSSSFSKLSPATTTVPCSSVPVATTKLTLSKVWPGVAITVTAPPGSSLRPSGSSSLSFLECYCQNSSPVYILVVDCMSHNVHLDLKINQSNPTVSSFGWWHLCWCE